MGEDCNLHEQACAAVLAPGVAVTLDISPKPVRAMTDLEFTVSLSDRNGPVDGAQVALDLSMPGMFMGENRSILSGLGNGLYRGKGVIPKCPSGKTLWRGDLQVQVGDVTGNVWFLFSVK